jgi:adenine phosphoribosyltransferase
LPEVYEIEVAGLRRLLPVREIAPGTRIAYFQMLGDPELCVATARALAQLGSGECQVLVVPEFKGVLLAHELARLMNLPYVVLRKSHKRYMSRPRAVDVLSFTGAGDMQQLWLDEPDADFLAGRAAWLVDDVLTTGNTMRATQELVEGAGGMVTEKMVVLTEGTAAPRGVRALGHLPVFGDAGPAAFHHKALDLRMQWPLVYTALSKHQFCYRVQISKFVLDQSLVPVNPAMNFDFGMHGLVPKDLVITANNNAIRVADEVWVFGAISDGVLAEILIARELRKPLRFFQITSDWSIHEIDPAGAEYEDGLEVFSEDVVRTA